MIDFNWERKWGKHFVLRCDAVTGHPYCCSLGTHIDLKHRYIAFHILWFYIHIGDMTGSEVKPEDMDEQQKIWAEYNKEMKAMSDKWQPIISKFLNDKGVDPLII